MNQIKSNFEKPMSFLEHLEDLRSTLLRCIAAVIVGFVVTYAFSKQIYALLMIPFNKAYSEIIGSSPKLIFTNLMEPFVAYIKVALVAGIFVSSPYIFYQLWKFISPGLFKKERKLAHFTVFLAALFFIGGAMFGYFVVFPAAFKFFIGFSTQTIEPAIKVSDYLKISLGMLLVFGIIFEFPLIVLTLVYMKLISPKSLTNNWRYIVVGIAIVSALLTPADPMSMILAMIPLCVLYLFTIIISHTFFKGNS